MKKPEVLGGDTPFFAAADAPFLLPVGMERHKPLRIEIDGTEQTRTVNCVMLASMQQISRREYPDNEPARREFMEGAIAGANTDLRALGISPLISFDEVDAFEAYLNERGITPPARPSG